MDPVAVSGQVLVWGTFVVLRAPDTLWGYVASDVSHDRVVVRALAGHIDATYSDLFCCIWLLNLFKVKISNITILL